MDIEASSRKWALKNRKDHGTAQAGALIGKVIGEVPDAKKDVAGLKAVLEKIAAEVNALSAEAVDAELSAFTFEAPKSEREGLPPLNIERVITRVAPNPSGFLHIGHAKNLILCDEYAKRYKGQLSLRLEDTDPKTKKPLPDAYTAIPEDAKWLGCIISRIVVQSERISIYYEHAEKLIQAGHAYVCSCIPEKLQKNRSDGVACGCRDQTPVQALREWKSMLLTTKEGKAVLRIKTDMSHPNASMRDWPAMRIVEEAHPRVGTIYRVWPLYNFAAAVDDHLMGITFVLRGKEHELNADKQQYIYDYFGWKAPLTLEYGLLHIEGAMAHKSDIIRGIKEGLYSGWDDVRLPTLRALRKRGLQPEALRRYMISLGVKPTDSTLDWDILYRNNRELLASAPHFYFVEEPVALDVKGLDAHVAAHGPQSKTLVLPLYPGAPDDQKRHLLVSSALLIAKKDAEENAGKVVRLKDLVNIDLSSNAVSPNQDHKGVQKIQWVSATGAVAVKVVREDGSEHVGRAEAGVGELKIGTVVQFERYGYARYDHDEKDGTKLFYYAHP
ncbi:glutamate--tRNA ligase [Candidatus Micrarchaeota archaeon]|nr:glutamate--tRNA ligase [Candidatus Micrarchaeota archaeon]